jgi:hypothetical protein
MDKVPQRLLKSMGNEWERVVLVVLLLLGLGLLVPGSAKLIALLRRAPEVHRPKVRVEPFFGETAFGYLTARPAADIGKNHVFVIDYPKTWRPPRPPDVPTVAVIVKPPDKRPDLTPPPPPPPPPPPAPKPVLHFYVYKGLGKSHEGHMLADVIDESSQGNDRKRAGSRFVQTGDKIGDFTVVSFTGETLILKNAATGQTAEIFNGDRFQYGTTPGGGK